MNKLATLMATAMMLFSLGCASPVAAAPPMATDNPKFLQRSEPVLGFSERELAEELGPPVSVVANDCAVPYSAKPGQAPVPVPGNSWVYRYQGPNIRATLFVCVVKGYAVGERVELGAIENRRIYNSSQEMLDLELIERAIKGELDDSSHEERTNPSLYNGPEYEI